MTLTFVNVGYGEAIIVDCSDPAFEQGHFIMIIDGGPKLDAEFQDCSSGRIRFEEYMQKSDINHIDVAVLTHIHEDHICGFFKAISMYPPKEIWQTLPSDFVESAGICPVSEKDTNNTCDLFISAMNDYCEMADWLKGKNVRVIQKASGDSCSPCSGLSVSILGPTKEKEETLLESFKDTYSTIHTDSFAEKFKCLDGSMNNYSLMLMLEYQGKRIFLPGDTNRDGYGDLGNTDIHADIFKTGHHGQKDGVSIEQVERIHPAYLVCCASSTNKYNSAEPNFMQALQDKGIQLCFSDTPKVPNYVIPPHTTLEFSISDKEITYIYKN